MDGGGIRSVLTLEILKEMENQLKTELKGDEIFSLSDYFNYIGGTSTSDIIVGGVGRRLPVTKLLDFYQAYGEAMFDKSFFAVQSEVAV